MQKEIKMTKSDRIKFIIHVLIIISLFTMVIFSQLGYSYSDFTRKILTIFKNYQSETNVINNSNMTLIFPFFDSEIQNGKNSIYCITTQIAWNKLSKLTNSTMEIEGLPEYSKKLNDYLDYDLYNSDDSLCSFAGYTDAGIINIINTTMKSKYNKSTNIKNNQNQHKFIMYSYIKIY